MTNEPVLVTAPVPDDKRRIKILLGVALVLALLLLVVPRVLGGEDPVDDAFDTPVPTTTTVARPRTDAVVQPASDKDPFTPLVAPRAPAAAPVVTPDRSSQRVRLVDVYLDPAGASTAKLRLDTKDLTVKAGQQFAGSYRVLTLDVTARCGSFLFGDQPFSLCAGEETSF